MWVKETGKQVYLGGYALEVRLMRAIGLLQRACPSNCTRPQAFAAEAFDLAAIRAKGPRAKLNFPMAKYKDLLPYLQSVSMEELVMAIRRCDNCRVCRQTGCSLAPQAVAGLRAGLIGISRRHAASQRAMGGASVFGVCLPRGDPDRTAQQRRRGLACPVRGTCTLACMNWRRTRHVRTTARSCACEARARRPISLPPTMAKSCASTRPQQQLLWDPPCLPHRMGCR